MILYSNHLVRLAVVIAISAFFSQTSQGEEGDFNLLLKNNSSDWIAETIHRSRPYGAMAPNRLGSAANGATFCSPIEGGFEMIYLNPDTGKWETWRPLLELTISYVALVDDMGQESAVLAARSDGGIDALWRDSNGNGELNRAERITQDKTLYTALAHASDAASPRAIIAARALGGVDLIEVTDTWRNVPILTDVSLKYVALAVLSADEGVIACARESGGLDVLESLGRQWVTTTPMESLKTKYIALIKDASLENRLLAAKANGGIDLIEFKDAAWIVTPILETDDIYRALSPKLATPTEFFGSVHRAVEK